MFKSCNDEDLLDPERLSAVGIPVRSVYYYGDQHAEGPVELSVLIRLKDNAKMTKDSFEHKLAQYAGISGEVRVFVSTGATKDEFEQIERMCEAHKWGMDYGNSSADETPSKKARVAPSSFEEIATDLAAAVMRIVAEARPSVEEAESLRTENAELRKQVELLRAELRDVRNEKDDYAIQCFELRDAMMKKQ